MPLKMIYISFIFRDLNLADEKILIKQIWGSIWVPEGVLEGFDYFGKWVDDLVLGVESGLHLGLEVAETFLELVVGLVMELYDRRTITFVELALRRQLIIGVFLQFLKLKIPLIPFLFQLLLD